MVVCSLAVTCFGRHKVAFHSSLARSAKRIVSHRRSTRQHATSSMTTDAQVMQDILYRVRDVNKMTPEIRSSLLPFQVDRQDLGQVRPAIADLLCETSPVFLRSDTALTLSDSAGTTCESRSAAVATVMEQLRDDGVINGWRDEAYPVTKSFYDPPVFVMERAAVPLLGAVEYGVHINGLVQKSSGRPDMWMARRSYEKSKHPGKNPLLYRKRVVIFRTKRFLTHLYTTSRHVGSHCSGWSSGRLVLDGKCRQRMHGGSRDSGRSR